MIKCCKCNMNILLYGFDNPRHGELVCPECKAGLYYVDDKTYPITWLEINHDTKTIKINDPNETTPTA